MKLEDVRAAAKSYGVAAGKLPKPELIKLIQVAEGNFACFATAQDGERPDCLPLA